MKKVQVVALVFLFTVGCSSAQKRQTHFIIEPADPDILLLQDDLFLKKAKMEKTKKKTLTHLNR